MGSKCSVETVISERDGLVGCIAAAKTFSPASRRVKYGCGCHEKLQRESQILIILPDLPNQVLEVIDEMKFGGRNQLFINLISIFDNRGIA